MKFYFEHKTYTTSYQREKPIYATFREKMWESSFKFLSNRKKNNVNANDFLNHLTRLNIEPITLFINILNPK